MKTLRSAVWICVLSLFALNAAPASADYPIELRGGDDRSFLAVAADPAAKPTLDPTRYDTLVVGAGLAGLTAALYLSDHGHRVLILEKEARVGGVASGDLDKEGIPYNRGAAYWTNGNEEEMKILEHIGLTGFQERFAIHEPIDSYLWNGKLYEGVWEKETLAELPASFALFKHELQRADQEGLIPYQPFEDAKNLSLDELSASEWIRKMPARTASRRDAQSKALYARFKKDKRVDPANPMKDVLDFLELFGRSALAGTLDRVSAIAFANFYLAEFDARFTGPFGTGEAAALLERTLRSRPHRVTIRVSSPVTRITNLPDQVRVQFVSEGKLHEASAGHGVFAGQLRFAPKIIEGLAEKAPAQARAMSQLEYAHCFVHVVRVKGHPYRASYDTWVRGADYGPTDFTDVILGRWTDPAIRGYQGMRDFKKSPEDNRGILAIYHNFEHELSWHDTRDQVIPDDHFRKAAKSAVDGMLRNFGPLLKEKWGTQIEVESVETNRWPFSMHVVRPGHFKTTAKELRKPFGRVFFANNNQGTPAFEEALFRGHCAANDILGRTVPGFSPEKWSHCPLLPKAD